MNKRILLLGSVIMLAVSVFAQNEPHYTMFMYNKLIYNPAYCGGLDFTNVGAGYRDQWTDIPGAPKTLNVTVDGPLGSYKKAFRKVAFGLSINSEQIGVETNTDLVSYYSYRIRFEKSILSLGLSAGAKLYTTDYGRLNPYQINDPNLKTDFKNAFLPNFGSGIYFRSIPDEEYLTNQYYVGFSVPNVLQQYYDKYNTSLNNKGSKEIRGYYLNGGYKFILTDNFSLMPQFMARYAYNSRYQLPLNCDFNLSAIFYEQFMLGVTYRTDPSVEFMCEIQITPGLYAGYAYDYMLSALNPYNNGTHEFLVGYHIIKENSKKISPRFMSF